MQSCTIVLKDIDGNERTVENAQFMPSTKNRKVGGDGSVSHKQTSASVLLEDLDVESNRGFKPVYVSVIYQDGTTEEWDVAPNFWDGSLTVIPLTK